MQFSHSLEINSFYSDNIVYAVCKKTKIGPSPIEGIGLFANEDIEAGALIWKFDKRFDLTFPTTSIEGLSESAKSQLLKYAYLDKATNEYVLCADDARFFNHSDDPNCIDDEPEIGNAGFTKAARRIIKGEELTCNYATFDKDMMHKLSPV